MNVEIDVKMPLDLHGNHKLSSAVPLCVLCDWEQLVTSILQFLNTYLKHVVKFKLVPLLEQGFRAVRWQTNLFRTTSRLDGTWDV